MKNRFILSNFFYFPAVLSLLLCFGCGDIEDEQEAISPINPIFFYEPDEQSLQSDEQLPQLTDEEKLEEAKQWLQLTVEDWEKLEDEDWEKLKGEDWIRLTDKEVKELMRRPIGRFGFPEQPWEEAQKDKHARFFQQFGDIPQLRYRVEFDRHYWKEQGVTITLTPEIAKHFVGYWAANYFLFPTEDHRRLLEDEVKQLKSVIEHEERSFEKEELRRLDQLRIEDPEAWVKSMRAFFIRKHGNTPGANTIIEFLKKLELDLPRADEECHSYLTTYNAFYTAFKVRYTYEYEYYAMFEAVDQVRPIVADRPLQILEKYREARAEGISFYDIDWDDD